MTDREFYIKCVRGIFALLQTWYRWRCKEDPPKPKEIFK